MSQEKKTSEKGNSVGFVDRVGNVAKTVKGAIEQDRVPDFLDRPELKPRFAAFLIDIGIGLAVVFLFFLIGIAIGGYRSGNLWMMAGGVTSGVFMLVRDGVYRSQSPGKAAVGLRVLDEEGHYIGMAASASRNLSSAMPFGAVLVYGVMNLLDDYLGALGGLVSIFAALIALSALAYETYSLFLDREECRRAGDQKAGTSVVLIDEI